MKHKALSQQHLTCSERAAPATVCCECRPLYLRKFLPVGQPYPRNEIFTKLLHVSWNLCVDFIKVGSLCREFTRFCKAKHSLSCKVVTGLLLLRWKYNIQQCNWKDRAKLEKATIASNTRRENCTANTWEVCWLKKKNKCQQVSMKLLLQGNNCLIHLNVSSLIGTLRKKKTFENCILENDNEGFGVTPHMRIATMHFF